MSERLSELAKRKEQALHAGSERSVERQHANGKMLARERTEFMLDPGSFHEIDQTARHRAHDSGIKERPYTDRFITGQRQMQGRKVFIVSKEHNIMGVASDVLRANKQEE